MRNDTTLQQFNGFTSVPSFMDVIVFRIASICTRQRVCGEQSPLRATIQYAYRQRVDGMLTYDIFEQRALISSRLLYFKCWAIWAWSSDKSMRRMWTAACWSRLIVFSASIEYWNKHRIRIYSIVRVSLLPDLLNPPAASLLCLSKHS